MPLIILKLLTDYGKYLTKLFYFLKREHLITAFIILTVSGGAFSYVILIKLGDKKNHERYSDLKTQKEISKFVNHSLKECGDKTAISIIQVDTEKSGNEERFRASFVLARACDSLASSTECIVDLASANSVYEKEALLDLDSYALFRELGDQVLAKRFSLKIDKVQDDNLSELIGNDSVINIIKSTNWYHQKILDSIWITSIITRNLLNERVIYVITLMSGDTKEESACQDQNKILLQIKNLLL